MGTQWELSNEYQHDMVLNDFLCVLVLWAKVASVLEGLGDMCQYCGLKVQIMLISECQPE